MKKGFAILVLTLIGILEIQTNTANGQTYCNPLNLSYRFSLDQPSRREISDPTIVLYKDNYYLFASKSGGYWISGDLLSWKFVTTTALPLEKNAPSAVVIGDWLYFFTSLTNTIFRSNDPAGGKWEVYNNSSFLLELISDPTIFADTDGRIYCYYGCTNNNGVMACELDVNNKLNSKGAPKVCLRTNPFKHRSKRPGSYTKSDGPGIEGSWMNKYNGKYYYQCAEFNPDLKSYSDVVYVSDSPFGPFIYAANNPFSSRPDGFICGAGHGSTFADKYGNWWHIATITAPGNYASEPRLGLFPAGFDKDGNLFTKTDFGDYPIFMPNHKTTNLSKLDPEWALLSYNSKGEASSSIGINPIAFAFDENIGSWWSAQTGKKGEWLMVDLGSLSTVNAVQINFAENKTQLLGRENVLAHQYLVEYSADKKNWKTLIDKTANTDDLTHQYEEMKTPVQAQYIKISNVRVPDGTFAISGFRVFGLGTGHAPNKVSKFHAVRDFRNPQKIKLKWEKKANDSGYNIRYGPEKNKLYHSYQVFKSTPVSILCLDKDKTYWFEIDAFNENGVMPGKSHVYPKK
jgi:xylan 1,4-beta-xylosidase